MNIIELLGLCEEWVAGEFQSSFSEQMKQVVVQDTKLNMQE